MKKTVSLLLALCLCLALSVMLVACDPEHTHSFSAEWSKNATHHWHACSGCEMISDNAEHTWNEGVLNEAETETLFTCTVCGATKTQPAQGGNNNEGVTEEEWNGMLASHNFENYTLIQKGTMVSNMAPAPMYQEATLKFANGKLHLVTFVDGEEMFDVIMEGLEAKEQKDSYETFFLAVLADFANFEYDPVEKVYKNPETVNVTIEVGEYTAILVMENGRVTISEDGKLVKFECKYTQTTITPNYTVVTQVDDAVFELFDYGTTVIEE